MPSPYRAGAPSHPTRRCSKCGVDRRIAYARRNLPEYGDGVYVCKYCRPSTRGQNLHFNRVAVGDRMTAIPMHVVNQTVEIPAHVNGQPITFILDTGDAIGPVFNADDAQRLGLISGAPLEVTGAGGTASGITETTADIRLGPFTYPSEPGAIDPNLDGPSLLGLPFFSGRLSFLGFDFQGRELVVIP